MSLEDEVSAVRVELDVLLHASMADRSVREVAARLDAGEPVEGYDGPPEELRRMCEDGTLREAFLRELVGEDRLRAIRKSSD